MASFAMADRIIVLDRGTIAGMDSHVGLLASNPLYRETFQAQLVGGSEEEVCE